MRRTLIILFLTSCAMTAAAQQQLSLDSCRALAIRNNKQLGIATLKKDAAHYAVKAAKTQYLPKLNVMGGYVFTSKEISLLNNEQKGTLSGLGTNLSTSLSKDMSTLLTKLAQDGVLTPEQAQNIGKELGSMGTAVGDAINHSGQRIVKAFDTDTRNIFMASAVVTQPIYMGGAITAANKLARITETMTANDYDAKMQTTLYSIDQAYWTVVSLKHKQRLAKSFLDLVTKLNGDVDKMIKEGVATRADGLKVSVKVNEAEMALTQVDNGLSLAKMLLCQLCGLPVSSDITLADEDRETITLDPSTPDASMETAAENRPELRLLQNAVDMSRQATHLTRAAYLPQVALTGGYTTTNPNLYNGFEKRFAGVWNVGVVVRVPVWNWFEGEYKVKASKAATAIASLELCEAREKIELQLNQSQFKVSEANRRLLMATANVTKADENLRCANLGFKEGVIPSTDVMEAQTAWLQAQTQKIDAEIELKLSQVNLRKALGTLQ